MESSPRPRTANVCGTASGDREGSSLAAIGDGNGDGVVDFVVGLEEGCTGICGGFIRFISGATGLGLYGNGQLRSGTEPPSASALHWHRWATSMATANPTFSSEPFSRTPTARIRAASH